MSGFGLKGPLVDLPSGDSTMQAYGGLMSIVGEPDRPPLRVGNVVTDMVAGANAFQGALLAVLRRAASGRGSRVDVSLLDSILAFQAAPFTEYLLTGQVPQRRGNENPLISPSTAMKTKDSYLVFAVLDHQWKDFCGRSGLSHLEHDPLFATAGLRQQNRRQLLDALEPVFASRTTEEWLAVLRKFDIACAPINDYASLQRDPQVALNQIILESTGDNRPVPLIANPVRLAGLEMPRKPPPTLGQHSREILSEDLGLGEADVAELLRDRVAVEDARQ